MIGGSILYYTIETIKQNGSPDMAYMVGFYMLIFSLIPHKEMRFMVAITVFMFLTLGYLLVRKAKQLGKFLNLIILPTVGY